MAVEKVFIGLCDEIITIESVINQNSIFIQIIDIKEPKIVCDALMDLETAIAFRDELNRLIDIMENNQL